MFCFAAPAAFMNHVAALDGNQKVSTLATGGSRPTTALSSTIEDKKTMVDVQERGGNKPIRKVLIANNGMAATKAILANCQWAYMEQGDEKKAIQFVAMATPEDIEASDEFIHLADAIARCTAWQKHEQLHQR
jgi:hypothetical protein